MSNELRQPRIAAQVCEIVHALSPGRAQNHAPDGCEFLSTRLLLSLRLLCFIHGLKHPLRQPPGYHTSSLSTDRGRYFILPILSSTVSPQHEASRDHVVQRLLFLGEPRQE